MFPRKILTLELTTEEGVFNTTFKDATFSFVNSNALRSLETSDSFDENCLECTLVKITDERRIVDVFCKTIQKYRPVLLTWGGSVNIIGSMKQKMLQYDIPSPIFLDRGDINREAKWNNYTNRYQEQHCDMYELLANYRNADIELNKIFASMGYPYIDQKDSVVRAVMITIIGFRYFGLSHPVESAFVKQMIATYLKKVESSCLSLSEIFRANQIYEDIKHV